MVKQLFSLSLILGVFSLGAMEQVARNHIRMYPLDHALDSRIRGIYSDHGVGYKLQGIELACMENYADVAQESDLTINENSDGTAHFSIVTGNRRMYGLARGDQDKKTYICLSPCLHKLLQQARVQKGTHRVQTLTGALEAFYLLHALGSIEYAYRYQANEFTVNHMPNAELQRLISMLDPQRAQQSAAMKDVLDLAISKMKERKKNEKEFDAMRG
jgi:hypothetical protein